MSLSDLMPESWKDSLSNHLQDIDKIGMELQNRADTGETILPNRSLVFRALEVPVNKVKVVIVGQDPYPNPKEANPRFVVVDVKYKKRLERPVTLAEIKSNPKFKDWDLLRISRLSVMPVSSQIWSEILKISQK